MEAVFHQEQLVLQVGPLEGDGVVQHHLPAEQVAHNEAVEDALSEVQPLAQQGLDNALPQLLRAVDPGGEGPGVVLRPSVGPEQAVPAPGGVRPGPGQRGVQGLQGVGQNIVVRVAEGQILPLGGGDAVVAGAAHPTVLLVDHPHPAVLRGGLVAEDPAAVGGAVVHQDQLQIPEGLAQDGVDAGFEQGFRLVDRYDYGNDGHGSAPFWISSLESAPTASDAAGAGLRL